MEIVLKGNLRPICIYENNKKPYWELCYQQFMSSLDPNSIISSILDSVRRFHNGMLVRYDRGINMKSLLPYLNGDEYCYEDPTRSRVYIGYEKSCEFTEFIFRAKLQFLHDITIIPSCDYDKDRTLYFEKNMLFYEYPSQKVFEKYGVAVGVAFSDGGIINIVSPHRRLCEMSQMEISYSHDDNCRSSLPGWGYS